MPLAVVKAADAPAPFGMQRIYEGQHGLRVAATAAASASGEQGVKRVGTALLIVL